MDCKNHPGVAAVGRCAGCSEAFCDNCLVEIQGQKYCGSCKVMAAKSPPVIERGTLPCKEAGEALKYAIVGIIPFCFLPYILEPMAIVKALKAKKMIAANPRLTGAGKASAALIIGIIVLVFYVLGAVLYIAQQGRM